MPKVHVQYFAMLREQRGLAEETLVTSAASPAALYRELQSKHRFSLPVARMRAAVNDDFVPVETVALREGDRVAFIPPVAGG